MKALSKKAFLVCGTAIASMVLPSIASAQITVTGSRIVKDGFDSPVPVTVVDAELIENLGQVNASDIIRLIPQNVASQGEANSGIALSPEAGASFANLRGLNPTYGTRTLTLVNGRRFVSSSVGGQVDLNLIPSLMISRIETVTGGASAAYGSDAIAGVVNIILDDKLEGFKGQVDYGQTGRGDGKSFHAAAAYGLNFAEDRGHFMVGGEYQRNRGIDQCAATRDWCAEGWTVFGNRGTIEPGEINDSAPGHVSGHNIPGSSGYGLPNYVIAQHGGFVYNSPYGSIRNINRAAGSSNSSFSRNYPAIDPPFSAVDKVFSPDGQSISDYDPGIYAPTYVGGISSGGDNDSVYRDQYIQTPVERYTTYASFNYELSDAIHVYSELTYGKRMSNSRSITAGNRSTMSIRSDNAYLSQEVKNALAGSTSFSFGKDMDYELDNRIVADVSAFRGLLGFGGDIFSDWSWDLYYQYGKNNRDSEISYSRHNDAFYMAVTAVEDPNNPGTIICRPLDPAVMATFTADYQAKLNDLYANCSPINVFGQGNLSQEGIDFAWRPVGESFRYYQHVFAGSVQGTLYEGWGAGPIEMATGFDYRKEGGEITHGDLDPSDYAFSFGLDYGGKIEVIEGFAEINVPVLSASALGDFELNGAIRYSSNKATDTFTDQSRTVNATSWKIGGLWDVTDGVRIRATQSRDIRAAGFRELFRKTAPTEEGTSQGRVQNPLLPAVDQTDATPVYGGGNFTLRPEIADTTTIGAVLNPTFLPGLELSLDWYQIKLKDAIANLNAQRVTDLCFENDLLCDRLTFSDATRMDVTRVDAGQANVGSITVRGFDFEASYHLPLSDVFENSGGSLDLRFLLNHGYDYSVQQGPGTATVNYAGQSGPRTDGGDFYPTPEWLWNALIAYNADHFNATATIRHIGSGALTKDRIGPDDPSYDPALPDTISNNLVDSATYVNLSMSYEIPFGTDGSDSVEIFGGVDNIFDKKPPIAPGGGVSANATAYPTNPVYFDTFGMRWRAGMRVKF